MTVPNIGDILVLSQKAWKIGRTFSACQKNAPVELQYVETEIGSLAKSLASLAETLHAESVRQLLQDADQEIKDGVDTIIRSCQRTVDDLDSLIDQYQVIKKHRTVGGFAIERSWSDLVLSSYRTMIWTPEGGNLADLKEIKSMARMDSTVIPMAKRIDNMNHLAGSIDQQLDEVHRMVEDLMIAPETSHVPPVPAKNPARSPTTENADPLSQMYHALSPPESPPRSQNIEISLPRIPQRPKSHEQSSIVRFNEDAPVPTSPADVVSASRTSSPTQKLFDIDQENITSSKDTGKSRGSLVEYSHRINQDDPRDVEMIEASEECRIAVVRKRVTDSETKAVRVVTSVWAFSDDNTTRVELRMEDDQMYIPYSSYFNPAKASITVLCELIFHDVKHGNRPVRVEKTSWVNYVFDSPQAAALFQNELMGRTLLATFRTEKTMRIHEGLSKSFSYAEQMCGLENLRVWEDNDTGAIIALIHFSADFRNGYLAFYLNSSVNPIRVKDGGDREVKIKGLRVPIDRGDRAMRKDSFAEAATASVTGKGKEKVGAGKSVDKGKVISGAKIEFATEMEKREFLEMCVEMQRELIELPDLLGVN
ncbi:uncharacterized protein J4E79_010860 [Alternaria viburni]|uniref:uncharacterized protein n=1 Tax=Alternaria viburni TaxID=566460 RepID=UPI0020C5285B|nr:uncharacterized protein J4E79_010860 [Alternaria viburni]KAI4645323.1 hypothetical protein J4E79_010860 [Alternaria viburni]